MSSESDPLDGVEKAIDIALGEIDRATDLMLYIEPPMFKGLSYHQLQFLMNQRAMLTGKIKEFETLMDLLLQGRSL